MIRRQLVILLAAMLGSVARLAVAAVATTADQVIVLRDDAQHELRLEHTPKRIISLLPSLTETVCALGQCERLIATDRYSNWPDSVKSLPKAGGVDDAQVELILSLEPDLVLLAHSALVTERLRSLGVPTFELDTHSYTQIHRSVRVIGQLLGVPERAAALNQDIEHTVDAVARDASHSLHGRSPLVYFEVDDGPYGAGPESFIGEMLARLGARNILTPELGPFPKLNPEYVVRHDPDVIFISPIEAPRLGARPGWDQIRAVKEQRLCSFADDVRDTIVRPGPRVTEGFKAVADCLVRMAP